MNTWYDNWSEKSELFRKKCMLDRQSYLKALDRPYESQKIFLEEQIQLNKETIFGKEHKFNSIRCIKDFQKKVPIRDYEHLKPYINLEIENKGGILSNSKIHRWLKTSGSTGNSKAIPYTEYWMSNHRVPALGVLWANYLLSTPEIISQPFSTLDTQTIREDVSEHFNGIPYQSITNRSYMINKSDWNPPWYDAPWFTADVPDGYDTRMYYRLRYFLGQDLRAILSINPSTLVSLYQHLKSNFSLLIREIYDGTLQGKKIFAKNTNLAKNLEKIQNSDFNLKDIWPNLQLIACWTSAAATLYSSQLNNLFPGVKVLPFMTCGTEGIVTLPVDDHPVTGPLAINQGFYEFLPASVDIDTIINSEEGIETLLFNQLKEGEEYHLIMTQGSGMCRYSVGDIYRVTGFYNGVPRIEFFQRNGTYFSFTGEKLTEPQVLSMVSEIPQFYGLQKGLFMCFPVWDEKPYYKILLEVNDISNKEIVHKIERAMDSYLSSVNEEYRSKRTSGRLGPIQLMLIKNGTIERFQDKEKAKSNPLQYKYKPFRKDDSVFKDLMQFASGNG